MNNFQTASYIRHLTVWVGYDENNWIFPHGYGDRDPLLIEPNITACDIKEHSLSISRTAQIPKKFQLPGLDNIFRRKNYILFESIFASQADSTVAYWHDINVPQSLYTPQFYSLYNVSLFNIKIKTNIDTLYKFSLAFNDLANIDEIIPIPDVKDAHRIEYNDSIKLRYIADDGLDLLVKFPKLQSLQESRNYIISAFITLFITLLATSIFKCFVIVYKYRKRLVRISKNSMSQNIRRYLNFERKIIFFDSIIVVIICSIIVLINPYEWNNPFLKLAFICSSLILPIANRAKRQKKLNHRIKYAIDNVEFKCSVLYIIIVFGLMSIGLYLESVDPTLPLILMPYVLFSLLLGRFLSKRKNHKIRNSK